MKRLTQIGILALLLSVFLPLMSCEASQEQADYTFLVYMNGSDLESEDLAGAASADLQEMMQVGSSDNVNIVIETGGTKQWANEQISGEANQRWLVQKGSIEVVKDDLGNRNIGDPKTLSDFIEWGVQRYPAKKYAYFLESRRRGRSRLRFG